MTNLFGAAVAVGVGAYTIKKTQELKNIKRRKKHGKKRSCKNSR